MKPLSRSAFLLTAIGGVGLGLIIAVIILLVVE
jgi:hypothetical protein